MNLELLNHALASFRRLDPNKSMMLSWFQVFGIVAKKEGLSVGEISKLSDLAASTTGKALAANVDLGLIVQREGHSGRVIESYLTIKGRGFISKITS